MLQSRGKGPPCKNGERTVWSHSPLRWPEPSTLQLARRHTTGQSSQQMPRLSTGLDSKDHPVSTERFSDSPLITVMKEGQLVHKVRLSSPFLRRQRLPPPIKYELAGTGQLGGKQREPPPCARRPNGSTRESGTESGGAHPRYAIGPSTRAGPCSGVAARGAQRPASGAPRDAGGRVQSQGGGDGIRPHLHVVWGRVNLLNHGSKCQRTAHNARPLTGLKCRSARFK